MNNNYAESLSRMIQKETVSENGKLNIEKFSEFQELLRELFPNIFAVCEFNDFHGSILMRWPGKTSPKPENQGLMLMNHQDVVEASGDWKYPPFSGEIAEGKVWGRGALDDKGELWAMLQAADELAAQGFVPEKDIWFESSSTEEITAEGAKEISAYLYENGYRFEMILDEGGMILKEPFAGAQGSFAMVGVGEKGCVDIKFTAKSSGGHASAPPKDTPLVRLGKFMSYVDRHEVFDVELSPVVCEMLRRLAPNMEGVTAKAMARPEQFAPVIKSVMSKMNPTAGALLKTTLAFTRSQGSNGNNVIPEEAYVIGNMRYSHHQGKEGSLAAIEKVAKRYNLEMEILDEGADSGISDWNSDAFKLMEEAIKDVFGGVEAIPYLMTGATDLRFMDALSDNCLRFAPFRASEEQLSSIHGINENVDVEALEPAVEFYKYIITNFK